MIRPNLTRMVLRRTGDHSTPAGLEWAVVGTLWLYLFSLILSLVVGRSVGSALFLHQFDGLGLACIYVLVGLTVAVLVRVLEWVGRGHSNVRVSATTLIMMYVILVAVGFALPRIPNENSKWFLGAFYLLIESFTFVTTVQFWATANAALMTEQANRLYVFVGTGGVMGSIGGGLLTRFVSTRPPAHAVLLIAAIVPVQLLLVFVFERLAKRLQQHQCKHADRWNLAHIDADELDHDADGQPILIPRPGDSPMEGPPTLPHRRCHWPREAGSLGKRFGLVAMLMVFSTTLVDFYYKMYAGRKYSGDLVELTQFFGNFYLAVGLATLVFQVIVTPFLLKRNATFLGMHASPLGLVITSVVNMLDPGIWSAAIFKLTDSVLSHSTYRSCHETLFTPLPTGWVRPLKSTCDGFYGRIGLLLAGVFLVLLSPVLDAFGPTWLLPWIAVSMVGWSLAIARLRRTYKPKVAAAGKPQVHKVKATAKPAKPEFAGTPVLSGSVR